jgi:hypothetical protein
MLLAALAWRCVQAKCTYFSSPEGAGGEGGGEKGEGPCGGKGPRVETVESGTTATDLLARSRPAAAGQPARARGAGAAMGPPPDRRKPTRFQLPSLEGEGSNTASGTRY